MFWLDVVDMLSPIFLSRRWHAPCGVGYRGWTPVRTGMLVVQWMYSASEMRRKIDKSFSCHFSLCLFCCGFLNSVTTVLLEWRHMCKMPMYSSCRISKVCVFAVLLIEIDYVRNRAVCIAVHCDSTCLTTLFASLWVFFPFLSFGEPV